MRPLSTISGKVRGPYVAAGFGGGVEPRGAEELGLAAEAAAMFARRAYILQRILLPRRRRSWSSEKMLAFSDCERTLR